MEIAIVLFVIAVIFVTRSVKVVPQQNAWVVERLGTYHTSLAPGLNFLVPFIDKVAYRHSLKEIPLDVPSQVCITRDNTQLQVDGILYFQVTDPMRASYGSSNYIVAVTQLAQTSLRSVIGKLELDKTFEERDIINAQVVQAIDEAALNWGVKVLRYEIKDLTPPQGKAAARSRSTSPPASARPSSPAPRAKSRRSSTKPRARRSPSRPSPMRRPRPSSAWLPPFACPAGSRRSNSKWPKRRWKPMPGLPPMPPPH